MPDEPVNDDAPCVAYDETLLRQLVPGGNPIWVDPERRLPVLPAAFLPSGQDADGLSLIRARYRSRIWAAFRPNKPDARNCLAPLNVDRLVRLAREAGLPRLDFHPSPDALDVEHGPPVAHCVAVQINRPAYERDKSRKKAIKSWAQAVANSLATHDVEGPFPAPTEYDAYRP